MTIQLMAVCLGWCVCVCGDLGCIYIYIFSYLNKTASFIGWDAQTQTVVWPSVDQIAFDTRMSLVSLTLSFLHFEIGSVNDIGIFELGGGISFEECRIKGSVYASYYVGPRPTYSFVNCLWLPVLSLSNFSSNILQVINANLIVESSQLTNVYFYYFYRGSTLVNREPCACFSDVKIFNLSFVAMHT